jgi:type II secretory ATPase GspE/PulE/Tfp pilus assembly ATPase PilB-like protein
MTDPRTEQKPRSGGERRAAWSWRVRKQPGLRTAAPTLQPPAEDLKTAEWRVLGLVADLVLRLDRFSGREPIDLTLTEQIAATLIQFGLEAGARTLYFEPGTSQMRVRLRINGELKDRVHLPPTLHAPLLAALKEAAGLEVSETRRPQEGLLGASLAERRLQLRLACLPGTQGEAGILHLPPPEARSVVRGLHRLGMFPDVLGQLDAALAQTGGMIVVAGPADSGPDTLYAFLHRINDSARHTITIEDPVEYLLPGVTQLTVDPGKDLTFPEALRLSLRERPDTIMLSDLPDPETASLALQAARSGRKVLAGFASDRAASVPSDLISMGVAPYQVAAGLTCILVQRRVRRLCDACKKPDPQTAYYRERLSALHRVWEQFPSGEPGQIAGACADCGYTGYTGHLPLFEVLPVTATVRAAILRSAPPEELHAVALQEGMISLADDGRRRANMGEVSLEDMLNAL